MIRDLMIGGASVEDTLTLWASSLRDIKQRIRPLFTQERVAASAGQFLDGLLGSEPRKTGWMRAAPSGERNGNYRHGFYTAEAIAERKATRAWLKSVRACL
jgi:hypothetical protein